MPLFRRQPETEHTNRRVLTINGHPQSHPEISGSIERRFRLFVECERRLADDPLAASTAVGQPIGDGCGLERLVTKVAPLFEREQSLIRWVALRGAFAQLFIGIFDRDSATVLPMDFEYVMGLEWVTDAHGEHLDLVQPWRTTLSPDQRQAALGVASSVCTRVVDYSRYSKMNVYDVNVDLHCQIPKAIALDCIAWSAIALLRLGIAQPLFSQVPEPDALSEPGWYIDPLFAKSERLDGSDWTARCRTKDHRSIETNVPLT